MNEPVTRAPLDAASLPKNSALATASVVLGILGLPFPLLIGAIWPDVFLPFILLLPPVLGILALVFAIIALTSIGKSGGGMKGKGQAIVGLITGGVSLLLFAAMLLPALAGAREKDRLAQCLSNMKQIGLAIDMYAGTHDGNIPRTFDDLRPYATNLDKLLICPSAKDTSHPSYQIVLGGGKWQRYGDNPDAVVVTESTNDHPGWGGNVLYNDGHVSWVSVRDR